jgi:adenine phosphoribosyltransferase
MSKSIAKKTKEKKPTKFQTKFLATLRTVPDFPKAGIMFKDITPILNDEALFADTLDHLTKRYKKKKIQKVVAIESRGFIFGAALAYRLGAGFVPVRKPNKLPAKKISETYELEYGTDTLEVHADAIKKGERVLIHDDLLATGGTALAAIKLVKKLGGKIEGISFLVELGFLNGNKKLKGYEVDSIVTI